MTLKSLRATRQAKRKRIRRTVNKGVALRLHRQALGALDLVSITSWRDHRRRNRSTMPTRPSCQLLVTGADNQSATFSQEVRGVFTGSRTRATLGANLFKEQASYGLSTTPPTTPPTFDHLFNTSDLTAWALFTQLELDVAEQLTVDRRPALRQRVTRLHDRLPDERQHPARFLTGRLTDEVLIPSLDSDVPDGNPMSCSTRRPVGATSRRASTSPRVRWRHRSTASAPKHCGPTKSARKPSCWIGGSLSTSRRSTTTYTDIQIRSTIGLGLTRVDNAAAAALHGAEASMSAKSAGRLLDQRPVPPYLQARYREFCQPISGARTARPGSTLRRRVGRPSPATA